MDRLPIDLELAGARLWGSETPIIKAVLLPRMWRRLELAADPEGRPGIASYRTDAAHVTLLPDPDPQECLDGFRRSRAEAQSPGLVSPGSGAVVCGSAMTTGGRRTPISANVAIHDYRTRPGERVGSR